MLPHFHQPRVERRHVRLCEAAEALHRDASTRERVVRLSAIGPAAGRGGGEVQEGLCKASVILVRLTPRYLTRPNCLRELQWALDLAYKGEKDVRILPLHPALTFPEIQSILQHGCVCVASANANGAHAVHRLSAKALELLTKIKQYMCLNWSDWQPWASDALGESGRSFSLPPTAQCARRWSRSARGGRVGLVNELVSKIIGQALLQRPAVQSGRLQRVDTTTIWNASAVRTLMFLLNVLDAYPELAPAFRQRVQDCNAANKLVAEAIFKHASCIACAPALTLQGPLQLHHSRLPLPTAPSASRHKSCFCQLQVVLLPVFDEIDQVLQHHLGGLQVVRGV